MVVEPRRTHVRFLSDELYRKWLVKVLFQAADGLYHAAGIAIRLCHSLKLFALLARWILPEVRSDGICFMSRSICIPRNGFAFEALVTLPETGRSSETTKQEPGA